MASIYRKKYTRPIPEGAQVLERDGKHTYLVLSICHRIGVFHTAGPCLLLLVLLLVLADTAGHRKRDGHKKPARLPLYD